MVGLFSARAYNIESLTVAETDHAVHTSRITIVTRGREGVLAQIKAQLGKIVQVRTGLSRSAATPAGSSGSWPWSRCAGPARHRVEALRIAEIFRARVIDTGVGQLRVRAHRRALTRSTSSRLLMRPLGLVEVSRTGVLSIARGAERV